MKHFNEWLKTHMNINPGQRLGPDEIRTLQILLGGSYGSAIQDARKDTKIPFGLKHAIGELVTMTPDEARAYRRDKTLIRDLSHKIRMAREFGGEIKEWSKRNKARLDETYRTTAPLRGEALRLWRQVHSVSANQQRQRRLDAA